MFNLFIEHSYHRSSENRNPSKVCRPERVSFSRGKLNHDKKQEKIIFFILILFFIITYRIFKYMTIPPGEKKHLNLRNMLTIEIQVDKWYSKKTVIMKNKVAIDILQDYLNSLDFIEVENDYGRNNMGHMYMMFLPYDSISIKGEYLRQHRTKNA